MKGEYPRKARSDENLLIVSPIIPLGSIGGVTHRRSIISIASDEFGNIIFQEAAAFNTSQSKVAGLTPERRHGVVLLHRHNGGDGSAHHISESRLVVGVNKVRFAPNGGSRAGIGCK
jgi:hypothetical protein